MKNLIKNPLFVIPIIILFGAVVGIFMRFNDGNTNYEFVLSEKGAVVQEVSVTGRVKPAESVNLAFERSGRVVWVNTAVGKSVFRGQALVRLYNSDIVAQIAEGEARVKAEQARLDELSLGAKEEEISLQGIKVTNSRKSLLDTLKDSYTKSDDAIRNKIDRFISNPRGATPQLTFNVDFQLENQIEIKRPLIENILVSWGRSLDNISLEQNLAPYILDAKNNLQEIQSFLDLVAFALNTLTPDINISQTTIDSYKSDVSAARTNVGKAITNVIVGESNVMVEENQLVLKRSSATPEQLRAQEAKIEQAEANVDNYKAQLQKTIIISPINGIATVQDAKVGEIVSAANSIVSLISQSDFEIESFIPEADIAKVKIGDPARVSLDAYGADVIFQVSVTAIDPAETVIGGVATYKITLQFSGRDERIKPGMTANIDILTARVDNVIFIPLRAVVTKDGEKFVRVVGDNNNILEKPVLTGLRGSEGNIEITDGLNEGEQVITFLRDR